MTASELFSLSQWVRSQASFQTFALNCCFPETLAEIVLGTVSSAVATVTDDGNYNFHVFLVVRKYAFEPVAQIVEVKLLWHLRLEDARPDCRSGLWARIWLLDAHAAFATFEEVAWGCLSGENVDCRRRRTPHAGISRSWPISGHLDSGRQELPIIVDRHTRFAITATLWACTYLRLLYESLMYLL